MPYEAAFAIASLMMSAMSAYSQAEEADSAEEYALANAKENIKAANSSRTLSAHMQALNDKRVMRVAGKNKGVVSENMLRAWEGFSKGRVETAIRDAEQLGAYTATAIASGVTPQAIDIVNNSTRMRQERADYAKQANQGYADFDSIAKMAGVVPDALALQGGAYNPQLDPNSADGGRSRGANWFQAIGNSGLLDFGRAWAAGRAAPPANSLYALSPGTGGLGLKAPPTDALGLRLTGETGLGVKVPSTFMTSKV